MIFDIEKTLLITSNLSLLILARLFINLVTSFKKFCNLNY